MAVLTREQALDAVFAKAEPIADSFGAAFLEQEFIRAVTAAEPDTYATLVAAYAGEDNPALAAQRAIGARLREVSLDWGYQATNQGRVATDAFGNRVNRWLFSFLAC